MLSSAIKPQRQHSAGIEASLEPDQQEVDAVPYFLRRPHERHCSRGSYRSRKFRAERRRSRAPTGPALQPAPHSCRPPGEHRYEYQGGIFGKLFHSTIRDKFLASSFQVIGLVFDPCAARLVK